MTISDAGRQTTTVTEGRRKPRNAEALDGRSHGKIQPPRRAPFLDSGPTDTGALLTIAEAADLLRISVSSVRRLQQDRFIPFLKVGGSVRFVRSDIASFLEGCRIDRIART